MKNQLDMIINIIDPNDEYKILIDNKRCKLPTAHLWPDKEVESKPGSTLIKVDGNKPALIRYALISLINHEKAHHLFLKEYPDFDGDHHLHPRFKEIEDSLRDGVDQLIFEEHD